MFGPHIHKGNHKTYILALESYMKEMSKCKTPLQACQIFVMGPQNTKENFTPAEAEEFGKFTKQHKIDVIVHNSYLVSLWNNNESRRPFARMCVQKQLSLCDDMGAMGLVIHIPNETPADIASEIKSADITKFKTPIYLETKASKPTGKDAKNYEQPANLEKVYDAIHRAGLSNHVGHCIDTAHLWSSGLSVRTHAEATHYMSELSRISGGHLWGQIIGGRPALIFHLNDNINDFADGKDEHTTIGHGKIWSHDRSGLEVIVKFIKHSKIPAILERNKDEDLCKDCDFL